jgi:DNA-binding beta-propeller fold protein YncE
MATAQLTRLRTVELPGKPLVKFDIGWVDPEGRRYYLADRSNARIAVLDVDTLEYVSGLAEGRFTGVPAQGGATAGPNGVLVIRELGQAWAGDGDSTVKIADVETGQLLDAVDTGGRNRVDELAYDPEDGIVLAANDQEEVPFATLISTGPAHHVTARLEFPRATNGLHQPVWDPGTRLFYLPVTEVDGNKATGDIAAIDATGQLVASHPVSECQPAGLTVEPGGELCVGCSKNAIAAGFRARTLIMDLETGEVTATIMEVGGSDEVWYNAGDGRYYLAASGMHDGPVLGVLDAGSRTWLQSIPTSTDAHSVAADPRTNRVFVPVTPDADNPRGGIAVFGAEV